MTFGLLWLDDFVNYSLKSSLMNVERCVSMDINTQFSMCVVKYRQMKAH